MDKAKIKNFIIIILLLVNMFLLAIVLMDINEAKAAGKQAELSVISILDQNGIRLDESVDISTDTPGTYVLRRDLDEEKKLVRKILGRTYIEDMGGNIYYYRSETGQASYRGTGEFDYLLDAGEILMGKDAVRTAKKILSKMGVNPAMNNDFVEVSEINGSTSVVLTCSWNGSYVFDNKVSFLFSNDSLILISGRRVFDSQISSGDPSLDALTILMRFLDLVKTEGHVSSVISGLTPGYVMNVTSSSVSELMPVWRIETDSGVYFLDGITGEAVANTIN